jgi:O-antigen biosynthesis protein
VFAEAAQKVPDTVARFGEEIAQRASLELADAVVSPSRWLFGWLDDHGWPAGAPRQVIQNLWESTALGEPVERAATGSTVRRLAFFGQLREGKGLRVFLASLQKLPSSLLEGVDLLFLGQARRWTPAQIIEDLGSDVVGRVASIRFETGLQREAAIAELMVPGTLAVMPSLLENSPYAVAECIEHGIPFLATAVGGTPELVAATDRERVLSQPNPDDFSVAIERALTTPTGFAPALPQHAPERSLAQWLELVETVKASAAGPTPPRSTSRVSVVTREDATSIQRAQRLGERTQSAAVDVVPAASRTIGLEAATADWLLFIDEDDSPDDALLDNMVAAQVVTGADVVTAGVRPSDDAEAVQLFLGDPGSLGLIENQYGVLGLVRRSLAARALAAGPTDSDWVLMARLAAGGAHVVSIPDTLSEQAGRPATVALSPAEGLAVLEAFEQGDTDVLAGLPLLTATLAAAIAGLEAVRQSDGIAPAYAPRALRMLRRQLRAIRKATLG